MLELRNITPDEFERWMRTEPRAHGARFNHDPEALRSHFDLARSIAVFEDGQIVGGDYSHLIEMSVLGGVATVAGLSNVEVQPTHTRRGIMMQMMRHQIDGIHKRSEPLAGLFATESAIYGRFGNGVGSGHEQWSIDKAHDAYAHRSQRNLPSEGSKYGTPMPTGTVVRDFGISSGAVAQFHPNSVQVTGSTSICRPVSPR